MFFTADRDGENDDGQRAFEERVDKKSHRNLSDEGTRSRDAEEIVARRRSEGRKMDRDSGERFVFGKSVPFR